VMQIDLLKYETEISGLVKYRFCDALHDIVEYVHLSRH